MCFFDVKHDVQFAHIFEVFVEGFDKIVYEFQETQFVLYKLKSKQLEYNA